MGVLVGVRRTIVWSLVTEANGLAFPRGGTLYFIDTIQVLLSLPISMLFGPAAAFNCIVLGELALAGVGAMAPCVQSHFRYVGLLLQHIFV